MSGAAKRTPPPFGPELRRMVWPLAPEAFLARHYQRRHFVSHGPARRVRPIFEALGVQSVEQYLGRRREPVQIWYQTREGDYGVVDGASPGDAAGLYRSGLTVYINNVAELLAWKERLGQQLGFEEVGPGAALFAARPGGGTRWHFDKLENFTIQLQGTKRWRVAPNAHVASPLDNWVTRQRLSEEMRLYVPDALPREAPPGRSELVELKPGSMLYLPRGYWHTAEASRGDTLAVTFLFPPRTWVSRFIPALQSRLTALPAWREHAAEALGDLRDDGRAREKVSALLGQLRAVVGQLRAEDFVPAEGGAAPRVTPRTVFRKNPLAFLTVGP
ncbi:MAG TPA: cupin domain-containing protein, partial [Myxococcales bacterium]|nr:cupin domain-containing protein [Myxococcales bacterium]